MRWSDLESKPFIQYSMLDLFFYLFIFSLVGIVLWSLEEITAGISTSESCWTMQYASILCLALRTPHEAGLAMLFLADVRASDPSMLLFCLVNPFWISSCNMSIPVLYYTSLRMTVPVIQKLLLNKRWSRMWQMRDYGRRGTLRKRWSSINMYCILHLLVNTSKVQWVIYVLLSIPFCLLKLFCLKLWLFRKIRQSLPCIC